MASEWIDKRLVVSVVVAAIIIAFIIYIPTIIQYLAVAPPTVEYKYTTDLTVRFKVMDDTTGSVLTANVQPAFYSAGVDPFAYTFTGSPLTVGAYDSASGEWLTVLDMGTYTLVVSDTATTKTKYPEKVMVSVPGTNEDDMKVPLNPYMIHMVERATPTITHSIYAYNETSGAYDISAAGFDTGTYSKWMVEWRFSIAGLNKVIKSGRIYLTDYTGLTVTTAYLDGVQTSVYLDDDASDDGMSGYYIVFPDWQAGTHYLTVYFQKTGSPSAGTYTLTLFEYYDCLLSTLRWWTDQTDTFSVTTS